MPKLRWILFALVLWIVFVIARIPATWGAWLITNNGDVGLSGVSGTLWQGRAGMASIHIDGQDYSLGEMSWKLQPLSLLTLRPCAEITTSLERQQIAGTACATAGGTLILADTRINAPVSLAQGIAPEARLDGQVSAHINQLRLKNQTLQALDGNLSWTGARVHNGQNWLNLGSFAAELSASEEGHIHASIFSLDGPIDLNGTVTMPLTGGIFIDTEFALAPAFAREVQAEQWLPMVAEPLDNGRHKLEMQL